MSLLLLDDWGGLATKRCMEDPFVIERRVMRREVAVLELQRMKDMADQRAGWSARKK